MFFKRVEKNWLPYLLFLPTLIFLAIFVGYPLLEALKLAFTSESGRLSLENFITLALDSTFWKALKYTLLFLVTIVPLDVLLAFLLAAVMVVALVVTMRRLFILCRGNPWYLLFYPVAAVLVLTFQAGAMVRALGLRGVTWRGTTYKAGKVVPPGGNS